MLRQSITRPLSTTSRAIFTRPFSAIAPRMGEGDTGAPRPGGAAQRQHHPIQFSGQTANILISQFSDVWQKRETAQENLYMYEREKEKLEALKKKIQEQREHLNELDKKLYSESGARRTCYFMAKDIPPFRAAHIIRIIQR
ncbi:hypothetical protein AN4500.2 [Aspergillus nidulans FGSC A4]|nr:hypothetical protein AN4500.2 [Aspergillus nidulans FGSC A4]|eukprot:XP_662104.1 hypothetical protein AN4500.2 [Aspergillus nidulans FGSC A4]